MIKACFLTTEGKVHTRGSKNDTFFGINGHLTVSSQVKQTALKQKERSQCDEPGQYGLTEFDS